MIACANIARYFNSGTMSPSDPSKALAMGRRACDAQVAAACHNVGFLFHSGNRIPQDFVQAAAYYDRGCTLNERASCFNGAILRTTGRGGPVNFAKALSSFKSACDLGLQAACQSATNLSSSGLAGGTTIWRGLWSSNGIPYFVTKPPRHPIAGFAGQGRDPRDIPVWIEIRRVGTDLVLVLPDGLPIGGPWRQIQGQGTFGLANGFNVKLIPSVGRNNNCEAADQSGQFRVRGCSNVGNWRARVSIGGIARDVSFAPTQFVSTDRRFIGDQTRTSKIAYQCNRVSVELGWRAAAPDTAVWLESVASGARQIEGIEKKGESLGTLEGIQINRKQYYVEMLQYFSNNDVSRALDRLGEITKMEETLDRIYGQQNLGDAADIVHALNTDITNGFMQSATKEMVDANPSLETLIKFDHFLQSYATCFYEINQSNYVANQLATEIQQALTRRREDVLAFSTAMKAPISDAASARKKTELVNLGNSSPRLKSVLENLDTSGPFTLARQQLDTYANEANRFANLAAQQVTAAREAAQSADRQAVEVPLPTRPSAVTGPINEHFFAAFPENSVTTFALDRADALGLFTLPPPKSRIWTQTGPGTYYRLRLGEHASLEDIQHAASIELNCPEISQGRTGRIFHRRAGNLRTYGVICFSNRESWPEQDGRGIFQVYMINNRVAAIQRTYDLYGAGRPYFNYYICGELLGLPADISYKQRAANPHLNFSSLSAPSTSHPGLRNEIS